MCSRLKYVQLHCQLCLIKLLPVQLAQVLNLKQSTSTARLLKYLQMNTHLVVAADLWFWHVLLSGDAVDASEFLHQCRVTEVMFPGPCSPCCAGVVQAQIRSR